MSTRNQIDVDSAADMIVRPVTPAGVQPPEAAPQRLNPPPEIRQNVYDVRLLLDELDRDPADFTKIEAVRGMLDSMRQYDPSTTDPASAEMVDDFCEAVESKLAAILTGEPDSAGAIGETANVGKSLGEIAAGWFPEIHRAGAWPFPQQGAPGSGLAGFYLAGRRVKRMAR